MNCHRVIGERASRYVQEKGRHLYWLFQSSPGPCGPGVRVTEDRENRAEADVDVIATFSAEWKQKLTIIRAYIIACLENQAQPDDLFAQKLKHYRQEWDALLPQAKAATTDDDGNVLTSFTISLERG